MFLTVTGGEALYADMGHFGKTPIRLSWVCIVMPALVLNYFGQGALLIENPAAIANPFYLMAPEWSLLPLVVIATAATVIASQAVISGVFSVTTQAVSLGLFPRVRVEHSSAENAGQIYVPTMNWILMVATLGLVLGFGSSAALAGAYGLAVSGAMTIVTPLTLSLIKSRTGKKSRWLRAGLSLLFIIDLGVPVGQPDQAPGRRLAALDVGIHHLLADADLVHRQSVGHGATVARAEAGARFSRRLEARPAGARPRYGDLHGCQGDRRAPGAAQQHQVQSRDPRAGGLLTVVTREQPRIAEAKRLTVTPVCEGIVRVVAQFGFMEKPNIAEILRDAEAFGVRYEPERTTYFLSREELLPGQRSDLPPLRRRAFMQMARSAQVIADYYGLPPGRVIEIGTRLEI